jgi:predicted ester cyclase
MTSQEQPVLAGARKADGKALVRSYLDDVFSNGNVDAMDRYLAGDVFKQGVRDLVAIWRTAFSNFHIEVDDALADDDKVVTVEILTGTHSGIYQSTIGPIAPTNNQVRWSRIAIRTLRDGRFVAGFFEEDEVGLLQQLGALVSRDDWAAAHRPQGTGTADFRVLSQAGSGSGPDPQRVSSED